MAPKRGALLFLILKMSEILSITKTVSIRMTIFSDVVDEGNSYVETCSVTKIDFIRVPLIFISGHFRLVIHHLLLLVQPSVLYIHFIGWEK